MESLEIQQTNPNVEISEDFVFIVPTYSDTLTDIASQFIDYKDNRKYLKGVIGGGEKNFGKYYIFSAKDLSKRHDVPLIFDVEKSGGSEDIENFEKEVQKIGITKAK